MITATRQDIDNQLTAIEAKIDACSARQVDVAQDGSMTVWDHGRAIYLSRELAQAVHMAYAHNCDGFECECFQAGHIQCAENGHS